MFFVLCLFCFLSDGEFALLLNKAPVQLAACPKQQMAKMALKHEYCVTPKKLFLKNKKYIVDFM